MRKRRSQSGGVLIEFALLVPLIFTIGLLAVEVTNSLFHLKIALTLSREAANFTLRECSDEVTNDKNDCLDTISDLFMQVGNNALDITTPGVGESVGVIVSLYAYRNGSVGAGNLDLCPAGTPAGDEVCLIVSSAGTNPGGYTTRVGTAATDVFNIADDTAGLANTDNYFLLVDEAPSAGAIDPVFRNQARTAIVVETFVPYSPISDVVANFFGYTSGIMNDSDISGDAGANTGGGGLPANLGFFYDVSFL